MYEAVYARPGGDSTAARSAATAASHGYAGVVIRTPDADVNPAAVREETGVDAVAGVEVAVDEPSSAAGHVGNARPDTDLLLVRGGTPELNRFAVEEERVDVLAAPMAGRGDFNHVLAKAAARNGVRVEFDLGPVLRTRGGERVRALQGLRKLRELVEQYDAPFVVSARANSHLQLRAPRELVAFGERVGFEPGTVRAGLREWGELVERNRRRRSAEFISPGVELDADEEDTR